MRCWFRIADHITLFYAVPAERLSPKALRSPMISTTYFHQLVLFLCIVKLGKTVSVSIRNNPTWPIYQNCYNLNPGECCKGLPIQFTHYFNPFFPATADWSNLLPSHVAAIWGRRGSIRDCSGTILDTWPGPGSWHYEGTGEQQPRGASYIQLPASFPPVNNGNVNWLMAEGMLGFVWGGGQWFAGGGQGSTRPVPRSIAGAGDHERGRRRPKRGIVSAQKGTAYVQPPRKWRWPDSVTVNGTEYSNAGRGDMRYESADGNPLPLNLTASADGGGG